MIIQWLFFAVKARNWSFLTPKPPLPDIAGHCEKTGINPRLPDLIRKGWDAGGMWAVTQQYPWVSSDVASWEIHYFNDGFQEESHYYKYPLYSINNVSYIAIFGYRRVVWCRLASEVVAKAVGVDSVKIGKSIQNLIGALEKFCCFPIQLGIS